MTTPTIITKIAITIKAIRGPISDAGGEGAPFIYIYIRLNSSNHSTFWGSRREDLQNAGTDVPTHTCDD